MVRLERPEVEVEIHSFTKKGCGLGSFKRADGEICQVEVAGVCPGDVVRVQLLRMRSGVYRSLFRELIRPSTSRITPACAHFGSCGGCRFQHTPYSKQLELKEQRVRDLLSPHTESDTTWHAIIDSPSQWAYRNKMEFSFSQNREGERFLGLMMQAGRGRVVDLEMCPIAPQWMCRVLEGVREWWGATGLEAYYPPKDRGALRCLTLREAVATGDRMMILLVSGNPDYAVSRDQLDQFVEMMKREATPERDGAELSLFLRIQQCKAGQPTQFFEMHLAGPTHLRERLTMEGHTLEFGISPTAFFQPNSRQAEALYARAIQLCGIPEGGTVLDLYCGTGTLGLFASRSAGRVIGVELSPESALDARENTQRSGVENVEIITGDAGKVLGDLVKDSRFSGADLVMVDPPRAGLEGKAMDHLLQLRAPKILYISCNPETQARDLERLRAEGYRIQHVQPVDQFPQTPHIENIVVLEVSA